MVTACAALLAVIVARLPSSVGYPAALAPHRRPLVSRSALGVSFALVLSTIGHSSVFAFLPLYAIGQGQARALAWFFIVYPAWLIGRCGRFLTTAADQEVAADPEVNRQTIEESEHGTAVAPVARWEARTSLASRAAIFAAALVLLPHAAIGLGAMALVLCGSVAAMSRPPRRAAMKRVAVYRDISPQYAALRRLI